MDRKIVIAAAILAGALAGCKQSAAPAGQGAKSFSDAARQASALPHPQPGQYKTTVELLSMDAPGMPPSAVDHMKAAMAQRSGTRTVCLKPEEAAAGYEARVRKLADRPNCNFDHYTVSGGKLDAQLTCAAEQGVKSVMTMHGTMTPTSSDVTMAMRQSGEKLPGGGMAMTMRVRSDRIGDCP